MKRICKWYYVLVIMSAVVLPANGQTYAYRLIKAVSEYGEVRDANDDTKVYLTFTNNNSSFYISKSDGSRAGWPDASTGYASGFNNQAIPNGNYSGISRDMRDPQNFQYTGTQGELRIYKNTRPLLMLDPLTRRVYTSGYTDDFVKFNADYSRINVIPSFEKGLYGFVPFGLDLKGWGKEWTTFVFEQVKQANGNGTVFY